MSRETGRFAACLPWGARLALATALTFAGAWLAPARARPEAEAPSPHLRLGIDRPAHPGERLMLHWESADESIRELEILLSVDGGTTYPICISPSMDPATGSYAWTVPNLGVGQAWLKIRFNRDGRELEGEATRLTTFLQHGMDLPECAVMPRDGDAERAPRSSGSRQDGPASRSGFANGEADAVGAESRRPVVAAIARLDQTAPRPLTGRAPSRISPSGTPPQRLPLRI